MKKTLLDRKYIQDYILLVIGCFIYAVSVVVIADVDVIPGSFLGIAVALNKLIGTPTGVVNLLLNIPVMILVTRKMGVRVLLYTIFIMVTTSLLIDVLTPVLPKFPWHNAYVLALIGGILMGIGAGMLIVAHGTMAGTTAMTLLVQRVVKNISFGNILIAIDSLIVLTGTLIVGDWKAILYSLLYVVSTSKVMDLMIWLGKKLPYSYQVNTDNN